MSNAVVTPLFPTGSRVRAWCVSSLARSQITTNPINNFVGQTQCDTFNFIDGYNLRLSGNFNATTITDRIYFEFVTPLSDASYRVFIQPRMNPTNEVSVNGFTLEPYRLCHVLNTAAFPKTRNGFWVRMARADENLWNNTASQTPRRLLSTDRVVGRQSDTTNASRKTLALSLVVL